MLTLDSDASWPAKFRAGLVGVDQLVPRSEISLQQIAAPQRLAEAAVAFSALVESGGEGNTHDLAEAAGAGVGRLVLFYDSVPQEGWEGNFRAVCYVKSPLESEIGRDELIADVAWSWLTDALEARGAHYGAIAATTTRILSRGFGELLGQTDHSELEIRASWSPLDGSLAAHVAAFLDLLGHAAALPPEGATAMPRGQQRN